MCHETLQLLRSEARPVLTTATTLKISNRFVLPGLVINTEVSTDSDEPGLASAWRPCLPVCWAAQWTAQSVQTPAKCYRQTPGPAAPTNIKLNQGFCSRIK